MTDSWEQVGYVISSGYRLAVLGVLAEGPQTPSQIAAERELTTGSVSRALQELRGRSLVELLVPEDRKKGRVYGITEKGEAVWAQIEAADLSE